MIWDLQTQIPQNTSWAAILVRIVGIYPSLDTNHLKKSPRQHLGLVFGDQDTTRPKRRGSLSLFFVFSFPLSLVEIYVRLVGSIVRAFKFTFRLS